MKPDTIQPPLLQILALGTKKNICPPAHASFHTLLVYNLENSSSLNIFEVFLCAWSEKSRIRLKIDTLLVTVHLLSFTSHHATFITKKKFKM